MLQFGGNHFFPDDNTCCLDLSELEKMVFRRTMACMYAMGTCYISELEVVCVCFVCIFELPPRGSYGETTRCRRDVTHRCRSRGIGYAVEVLWREDDGRGQGE